MIINSNNSNVYFVNRNESIDRYLNSIRNYKPLEFEEENMYITRYKVDGDIKASDAVKPDGAHYENMSDDKIFAISTTNVIKISFFIFISVYGCKITTYSLYTARFLFQI